MNKIDPSQRSNWVTVNQMHAGQSGCVVQVSGGRGMTTHLQALGIMPGKIVTKVSSAFMRGPVVIVVDRVQVAIGFGMASRIIVTLDLRE
jgi:ferrous iron transport protein A